jgi:hypothetical protein
MEIRPFGKIDADNLADYYYGELLIHSDKKVEIDLNFESVSIDSSDLDKINEFINDIETYAKKAFDEISKDYDLGEESESARLYLQHHFEEFTEEEIIEVFGTKDIDKQTFLNSLMLRRVGLYPEDDESYAIFDIQFPEEHTNYVMAVNFNSDGHFSFIDLES